MFWLTIVIVGCTAGELDAAAAPLAPSSIETDGGTWELSLAPTPDPFTAGEVSLDIGITDLASDSVDADAEITALVPWMPDHGHGISGEPAIAAGGDGTHTASWAFTMSGYWELTIEVDGAESAVVAYEVQ